MAAGKERHCTCNTVAWGTTRTQPEKPTVRETYRIPDLGLTQSRKRKKKKKRMEKKEGG